MNKINFQIYLHFVKRMQTFYQENETTKDCDIVFVGDSIIEMYDLNSLNLPYHLMNRGIVSDKSAGVLMSFDDRVLALNPKVVVMLIGSNDICDGYLLKQIENNIEEIILMLKEKNIPLILFTTLPPCYHEANHVDRIYPNCRDIHKMQALNEIIKDFAKKYDHVTIVDCFSIYADKSLSLSVEDTLDGIHLTPKAYEKVSKVLRPILIEKMKGVK